MTLKFSSITKTAAVALLAGAAVTQDADAYRLIQQTGGAGTYTSGSRVAIGAGETIRWVPRHIDFRVNTAGAGDGNTLAQTRAAVAAAYRTWEDVSCAGIRVRDAGTTARRRNPTDNNNTTYWAESGDGEYSGPGTILGPGTLAITIITIRNDQTVTDVDIAFNGRDFNWAPNDGAGQRGIQDTETHEVGHLLGFHHTNVTTTPTPTMNAFDQPGDAQTTLEADDENALCFLYARQSGGNSNAAGDFNGDGSKDLAIGVPNESIGSTQGAGAVNVIYGSNAGLTAAGDQLWHQNVSSIAGVSEANDHFGSAVAAGDFNGDGYSDLAIGVRNEAIGSVARAGAVNVLYGGPGGLRRAGNQIFHQNTPSVLGVAEAGDQFGSALVAGDFNNDGRDDLAIGVSNESIGTRVGAGAVNVLRGSPGGLTAVSDQLWHQDIAGIQGVAEIGDNFGAALSSGDYNDDGYMDLAVGVVNEDIGTRRNAGAVNVLYGSLFGLRSFNNRVWHENSLGIVGVSEAGDNFGSSLVSGDFNGNGVIDLAIGTPGEDVGSIRSAGQVNIMFGSPIVGLTANGDQALHQNSVGIQGVSEAFDEFGTSLAAADFNVDGFIDLAVGTPLEAVGAVHGAGIIQVLRGGASGITSAGNQLFSQANGAILGVAERDDEFGAALVAGRFRRFAPPALAVGVPKEAIGSIAGAGAVNVIYSNGNGLHGAGDQIWHQNSPGIGGAAEANDGFGQAL